MTVRSVNMRNDLRPEDDLGLDGKVGIVTGGGAPDDGTQFMALETPSAVRENSPGVFL
jgi:hypothetical protein